MELQRGNVLAAVLLLERCVKYDASCRPVLQWRIVQAAKEAVSNRIRRQLDSHVSIAEEMKSTLQNSLAEMQSES